MENQTQDSYKAVYLTAEDLRVAASILYNAYHDDPFFMQALGHEDKVSYEQKLRAAIREELNELWQQEQTLVGWFDEERLIGVACVVKQQVGLGEAKNWHWRLKMLLGTGWQSTQMMLKKEASIVEHLPGKACGILQFIALAPSEQGKGHGAQLLRAVQSWCDDQPELDGIGVFVSQDAHQHLFVSQGFESLGPLSLGKVDGELLFYRRQHYA
ncbi:MULTISPECIES: GNAT family N-acetyltransferase [Shewanella]|jgi:GNAT superfamily N-acetyltransferase|uniref:GNAT family N-acetyltransferase n=2 Tax=Shewanella TaxID=22 RepID=A0AAJ1EZQ2_9GAMM|nr:MULTISPECIES: GNAT family N-acetyltransferase [Shewanella]AZQ09820.1 Acetyltransferase (GNAT) family protein [Shewanella khirikhana]MCH4293538.1 GNAT family N-acetyltransferase [Shewanella zhuhaiensis]